MGHLLHVQEVADRKTEPGWAFAWGQSRQAEPRAKSPGVPGLHSCEVCKGHRLKAQRSSWEGEQSGQAPREEGRSEPQEAAERAKLSLCFPSAQQFSCHGKQSGTF